MFGYKQFKRVLDIVFALILFLLTLPVMVFIGICVRLESGSPIVFKQVRIGLRGGHFTMYKFRTMCMGAESGGVYEKKGDSRVTIVGRFLRKTSLDELPQLINILRGEMSFIGPRPVLTYHPCLYEDYTAEQLKMFSVRPGITGWAQVNGRKTVEWGKRIELNMEYVDRMSFLFDLKILIKTVGKVLFFKDNLNVWETAERTSEGHGGQNG